tara:strand:+ start:11135 stop:11410 length:276 start_codon:yes stop_codon:yes gene_type:complete
MPKGTKFNSGYATVTNRGLGYREIAEKMTEDGDKMNHATARNHFLRAMEKIAKPMVGFIGSELTPKDLAVDPGFQDALIDIISSGRYKNAL